jgi:hypothetical protein
LDSIFLIQGDENILRYGTSFCKSLFLPAAWGVVQFELGIKIDLNAAQDISSWVFEFNAEVRGLLFAVGSAAVLWSLWKTRNEACFKIKIPYDPTGRIAQSAHWLSTWVVVRDHEPVRVRRSPGGGGKKPQNPSRVPSSSPAIPSVRSASGGLGALEVWRTTVPRRRGVSVLNLVCFSVSLLGW